MRPMTGRHVLLWLLGFFAVVFVANGLFVYFATQSWTGLDTEDAYRKGLDYNSRIEAARTQQALGWAVDMAMSPVADSRYAMTAHITDAAGAAVTGLAVEAVFRRPVQDGLDRRLILRPGPDGAYAGVVDLPASGVWDVRMVSRSPEGQEFIIEKRVVLK